MARDLAAVNFLHKPIDEQILASAVDRLLGMQVNTP